MDFVWIKVRFKTRYVNEEERRLSSLFFSRRESHICASLKSFVLWRMFYFFVIPIIADQIIRTAFIKYLKFFVLYKTAMGFQILQVHRSVSAGTCWIIVHFCYLLLLDAGSHTQVNSGGNQRKRRQYWLN